MAGTIPHPYGVPNGWDIPHPDVATAVSAGLLSYGSPGSGGRQPIAYAGQRPASRPERRTCEGADRWSPSSTPGASRTTGSKAVW